MAASISGGFDFGTRSGNGTKEAPHRAQWVVQPPTAFTWLTVGWRFKAAACVNDFLSCGTPAQATLESSGAHGVRREGWRPGGVCDGGSCLSHRAGNVQPARALRSVKTERDTSCSRRSSASGTRWLWLGLQARLKMITTHNFFAQPACRVYLYYF